MTDELSDDRLTTNDALVVEDAAGALIVGDDSALEAFITEWRSRGVECGPASEVTGHPRAKTLAAVANAATAAVAPVRYLRVTSTPRRGETVVIRKWVQDRHGTIIENKAIDPRLLLRANPEILLASAAVQFALAEATREITAALERVEDKTDDLLRLANADRLGDVNGHFQLLDRMVRAIDAGSPLTDTDWSSIAALGPLLETCVERLRTYLTRLVGDLPTGLPAVERSERLSKAANDQRLGEMLQLLTISQQSLYLWQRLRIERVDAVEPEHLEQTIASAHSILGEQLKADLELITQLRQTLSEYGSLAALEFHRKISGRRLRRNLAVLQSDLDMFAQARGLQVHEWAAPVKPTAKDALEAAGKVLADQGRQAKALGGRTYDAALDGVGRAGGAVHNLASRRLEQRAASASMAPADIVEPE